MSDFALPLDVLEFPRATLYTQAPGVENERASFGWSLLNGNPRITVWTRVDDKEKGPITGGIGPEVIEGIFDQIEALFADQDRVDVLGFDCLVQAKRDDGQMTRDKKLAATFYAGRGEDGLCFFSMKSADTDRPEIIFQFRAFEWHPMRRRSKPLSDAEISMIHGVSMVKYLRKALSTGIRGQTREERKAISEARKARRTGTQTTQPQFKASGSSSTLDDSFNF